MFASMVSFRVLDTLCPTSVDEKPFRHKQRDGGFCLTTPVCADELRASNVWCHRTGVCPEDQEKCTVPLVPGTPLSPTSLLAVDLCQIGSAVSLLDFYCRKNYWSEPEYQLYSTLGQNGALLLLYKVWTPQHYLNISLFILLERSYEFWVLGWALMFTRME